MQPALDSVEILAARITTRFAAIAHWPSALRALRIGLSARKNEDGGPSWPTIVQIH